jgi:hypothetical protein
MVGRFVLCEVILNEGDRAKSVSLVVIDCSRLAKVFAGNHTRLFVF